MTEQNWNEFLEKLDFAQLTSRWSLLPLHWLDDHAPSGLSPDEELLYRGLVALPKDLEPAAREDKVKELVSAYREGVSSRVISLDASLTPPGSRVILRYFNPEHLGQGDCLITVGSWDRLGYYIAEKAGLSDQAAEPSENAVRRDPGKLAYRDLLVFPDKGTPSPRAFRALCEKTLRQARGLGARRLAITHLQLPLPGLPDRFAAAELVSAVRGMLREGGAGITVEILPLTRSVHQDYHHWFRSLGELARGDQEDVSAASPGPSTSELDSEPVLASALRDLAQKTSSLAQEAGRGVSSWFRNATSAVTGPPAPSGGSFSGRPQNAPIESTFEDQQALNLLYLGRWKEAEAYSHRWQEDSLVGLYLAALHKVVSYIDLHPIEDLAPTATVPTAPAESKPEPVAIPSKKKTAKSKKKGKTEEASESPSEPESEPEAIPPDEHAISAPSPSEQQPPSPAEQEYQALRGQLLSTAQDLGSENQLARYFQLLAWRLDQRRPNFDPDQLEEDHARLLRAAWAWEDTAMLTFLRGVRQDQETAQSKPAALGYVPVFPSGSRAAPRLD